jgi:hypothetical protein
MVELDFLIHEYDLILLYNHVDWQEIEYQVFDSIKQKTNEMIITLKKKFFLLYSFDQNNNIYRLIFHYLNSIKMFYRTDRSKYNQYIHEFISFSSVLL